jgi:hypothetical protein
LDLRRRSRGGAAAVAVESCGSGRVARRGRGRGGGSEGGLTRRDLGAADECMGERRRRSIFRSRRQAHLESVTGIGHPLEGVFEGFDPHFEFR